MGRHLFDKEGCGSLELVFGSSFKQVFRGKVGAARWRIEGLTRASETQDGDEHLFEYQPVDYSYTIGSDTSLVAPFRLLINDRLEKESSFRKSEGVHILAGRFVIKDSVGSTEVRIVDSRGQLVFRLETEVYPQKMDFASDYKAMLAEITAIVHNLTYDALKDTYRMTRARVAGHSTQLEWWAILDELFEKLLLNLAAISKQSKHDIRYSDKVTSIEQVTKASKGNLEWLKRNGQHVTSGARGLQVMPGRRATRALAVKKYVTYDTYENRFVAWAIKGTLARLRSYKRVLESFAGHERFNQLTDRVTFYQGRLQSILHAHPFSEVSQFEERSHFSTTMTRGAGYRDFLVIHLLLTRGLELWDNDLFRVSQKDVSTLYEYWCFLKLVQLLKEESNQDIDLRDLIKVVAGRAKVTLKEGRESGVHFTDRTSGKRVSVFYNKNFTKATTYTFDQRPDISLRFQKSGLEQPFWMLFDAKYRFEERQPIDGTSYDVPNDAIGQLHRYRDAILHTEPKPGTYRRALKNLGGIILYPFPLEEADFTKTPYFKSIEEVNIGALPFLPGKTRLVKEYLTDLLAKQPMVHFEEYIEMDRTTYEDQRKRWSDWVAIGVIPKGHQNERIAYLEGKRSVHFPFVRDNNSRLYSAKELLMCIAGTRDAILCRTTGWEVLTSDELKATGTTWPHSHDHYVVFSVDELRKVRTPKPEAPVRFRYSTHEGLNRYLSSRGEDAALFYLTSPDAARLYEQLKSRGVPINCDWGQDERDPSLMRFAVRDITIYSSERFAPLHYQVGDRQMSLREVLGLVVV
ncbi:MAG: DUF2357 domain-containing protein [Flavobacteriales bacterium]|nr:DUF2357 domain-containing protein [Flavobacteriales bacterium]